METTLGAASSSMCSSPLREDARHINAREVPASSGDELRPRNQTGIDTSSSAVVAGMAQHGAGANDEAQQLERSRRRS
jgi:hypothetical protein